MILEHVDICRYWGKKKTQRALNCHKLYKNKFTTDHMLKYKMINLSEGKNGEGI